jgi:hypothetical protein
MFMLAACLPVAKRLLQFAIFAATVSACDPYAVLCCVVGWQTLVTNCSQPGHVRFSSLQLRYCYLVARSAYKSVLVVTSARDGYASRPSSKPARMMVSASNRTPTDPFALPVRTRRSTSQ